MLHLQQLLQWLLLVNYCTLVTMMAIVLQPMAILVQMTRVSLTVNHHPFIVVAVLHPIMILQRRRRRLVVLNSKLIVPMIITIQRIRVIQ
jgi:hypothetical protein